MNKQGFFTEIFTAVSQNLPEVTFIELVKGKPRRSVRGETYQLFIVLRGRSVFSLENKKYNLDRWQALYLLPGQNAVFKEGNAEYYQIGFKIRKVSGAALDHYPAVACFHQSGLLPLVYYARILEFCSSMLREYRSRNALTGELLSLKLSELLAYLYLEWHFKKTQPSAAHGEQAVFKAADRVLAYLKKNYRMAINFEGLFREMGFNPNYLRTVFKKSKGISIQTCQRNLRIKKAHQLIKENKMSLKEISAYVGYNDYYYFLRVFKQAAGRTAGSCRPAKITR